jgi:chromosome segregation ATPase
MDFKPEGNVIECKYCNQKRLYKFEVEFLDNNLTEFRNEINHIETKINLKKIKNDTEKIDDNLHKKMVLFDTDKNNNVLEKLQNKIKELDEANKKIKFYQDENVRLSSQLKDTEKKYEIINDNFNNNEKEKNVIFKQIQELNNSLHKNNIFGTPFIKNINKEKIVNSKFLDEIAENNLKETKTSDKADDLNFLVKNIFGK